MSAASASPVPAQKSGVDIWVLFLNFEIRPSLRRAGDKREGTRVRFHGTYIVALISVATFKSGAWTIESITKAKTHKRETDTQWDAGWHHIDDSMILKVRCVLEDTASKFICIYRSRPVLAILVVDYHDAVTKSFSWLFRCQFFCWDGA